MKRTKRKMDGEIPTAAETLASIDPESSDLILKRSAESGPAMCTFEDLLKVTHSLAILIRWFVIKFHITMQKYEVGHAEHANATAILGKNISSDKSNQRRQLENLSPTWDGMAKFINTCGYSIVDVDITLRNNKTGEIAHLKKSDAQAQTREFPYGPGVELHRVTSVSND